MRVNKLYSGPPVKDEDIIRVYVVLNGALEMSPGKMAAQAFHCGWYFAKDTHVQFDEDVRAWEAQGRRVVVRIAETADAFARVLSECEGWAQRDEGLTEVESGTITAVVTRPYTSKQAPKILSHKRVRLA